MYRIDLTNWPRILLHKCSTAKHKKVIYICTYCDTLLPMTKFSRSMSYFCKSLSCVVRCVSLMGHLCEKILRQFDEPRRYENSRAPNDALAVWATSTPRFQRRTPSRGSTTQGKQSICEENLTQPQIPRWASLLSSCLLSPVHVRES